VKTKVATILIVDYDASTRRTFRQILTRRGFSVDEAKEGEEAMMKMKTMCYDAVLLSFELPDMHGTDLLFFLKKSMPNVLKIITTGFPSLDRCIGAVEAGADAYFAKPVDPEILIIVIEEKLRGEQNKLPTNYN
jgi:DNA-binding NtrC family response regulator